MILVCHKALMDHFNISNFQKTNKICVVYPCTTKFSCCCHHHSALCQHALENDHKPDFGNCQIIYKCRSYYQRIILESQCRKMEPHHPDRVRSNNFVLQIHYIINSSWIYIFIGDIFVHNLKNVMKKFVMHMVHKTISQNTYFQISI